MAQEGQKSEVSLVTEEVKAAGLQVKPTIDNFNTLITKHYGTNLRLNEMTGKPEFRRNGAWREWTDTEESRMRAYFERNYSMYNQNKMTDALMIYFNNNRVNPLLDHEEAVRGYIRQAWAEAVHLYKEGKLQPFAKKEVLEQIRAAQEAAMEDDWRVGQIEQYLDDMKKAPNSTVSVIELWHKALGEPDERKPTRSDSIAISQIVLNIPGWTKYDGKISTLWGRQKGFKKTNPFFPSWR